MLLLLNGTVCALLLVAGATDLRSFRIPNWVSLALIGLFVLRLAVAPHNPWPNLAAGFLVLAGGFALFMARLFGAGDAKLLGAISLWIGTAPLAQFLITTALAGGVLATAILLFRKVAPAPAMAALSPADGPPADAPELRSFGGKNVSIPIPYGVAIAAGGLWTVATHFFGS